MRVTVIATGFDRLIQAERETDKSMETAAPQSGVVLARETHEFEMDEDVLDIPRFLRDKD